MSFDKQYPNRKDRRKPYRDSRRFDINCRCHGSCNYCNSNRNHSNNKRLKASEYDLRDFEEENEEN